MTSASARSMRDEKVGSLIASPASSVRRGSVEMSISSVSTPGRRASSETRSRAAGRLIRPWRTVPRITGTNKGRSAGVIASGGGPGAAGIEPARSTEYARAGGDESTEHADDTEGHPEADQIRGEADQRWPGEEAQVAGGG